MSDLMMIGRMHVRRHSKAIKVKCNIVPLCPPGSTSLPSVVQRYMHEYQAQMTTNIADVRVVAEGVALHRQMFARNETNPSRG